MKVRWLGWAGVEIEAEGAAVVIDALADPAATFAALGEAAAAAPLPEVAAPGARRSALAGFVSHLHRDHADAAALAGALAEDAAVHEPRWPGGEAIENLAIAQADAELDRARLPRRRIAVWEGVAAGPFTCTALPAVDGLGDPQVSWLIEADGRRVLHLGDTLFHGYWWRMARRHGPFDVVLAPINGAAVNFPHLQPPSELAATMGPDQAAAAAAALGAATTVPMHYGGYDVDPWYRPQAEVEGRFEAAMAARSLAVRRLAPGEELELKPVAASPPAAAASPR